MLNGFGQEGSGLDQMVVWDVQEADYKRLLNPADGSSPDWL